MLVFIYGWSSTKLLRDVYLHSIKQNYLTPMLHLMVAIKNLLHEGAFAGQRYSYVCMYMGSIMRSGLPPEKNI